MKRFIKAITATLLLVSLTACGGNKPPAETSPTTTDASTTDVADTSTEEATGFKVVMVTDTGGVSDQSFNQSAWEGFTKFKDEGLGQASYIESHKDADYVPNLSKAVDQNADLIWAVGYLFGDHIVSVSDTYPDANFAIVDFAYEETPENVASIVFKSEEPSFLVGYLAALTTKTDKVGFIGGMKGVVIEQFEYGYRAGVAYANKETGKNVEVDVQYAESFSDSAKGKAIAQTMYTGGCDIVFHAAGNVGQGVIAAAQENNKFVIGVDRDQSALAPDNVITSALKLVGPTVYDISKKAKDGEQIGGQTFTYGVKEGACGIPAYEGSTAKLVEKDVYDKTIAVQEKIISGEIVVPSGEAAFNEFK